MIGDKNNGDGVLDYGEFCTAMTQQLQAVVTTTITTTSVPMSLASDPVAVPVEKWAETWDPNGSRLARIMEGDAWAAVEAAQGRDWATLWAAFKKHKVLVAAGELDDIVMHEWIGAVQHNTVVDLDSLIKTADDSAIRMLIVFAHSMDKATEFFDSDAASNIFCTSETLNDATKLELWHKYAARAMPNTGQLEAALPILARISKSGTGTALGYFGEYDVRSVACTALFHLATADDRNDLVRQADALGMVDATIDIAKSLLQDRSLLYKMGITTTILDCLQYPEGFEERIAAALGVEDLQMGLLPDEYWED